MAYQFANNAVSSLAASVSTTDTEISLIPGSGLAFPALAVGDWFTLSLIDHLGNVEIVRCTARAVDLLTVERGQEGTQARIFNAGARVEHRLTAGVLQQIVADVFSKLSLEGGTLEGALQVLGAATVQSLASSGAITQNGQQVWHTGNLNPAVYLPLAGGTVTGGLTISNAAPTITLQDIDNSTRSLHCNSNQVGFLTNTGNWACYSNNDGTFVAVGNIAAFSDRKHKTDIKPIQGGLALIERLRGVRYTDKKTGAARIGVIAQEVREVLPEVVGEDAHGLHVDYGNLVAPLIEAVKELAGEVRMMNRGL